MSYDNYLSMATNLLYLPYQIIQGVLGNLVRIKQTSFCARGSLFWAICSKHLRTHVADPPVFDLGRGEMDVFEVGL